MTAPQTAESEADRHLVADWKPPDERWHLLWLFPLWGFNAGNLKTRALEVADTDGARPAELTAAQAEVAELERELRPFRALDSGDDDLDSYVQALSQLDPSDVEGPLAAVLDRLLPHLHESQRRSIEYGRRRAEAQERLQPLRAEEAEIDDIRERTWQMEQEIEDLSAHSARLRHESAEVDAESSAVRHDVGEVHRLVSLHLRMNGLGDVVRDLEELLASL